MKELDNANYILDKLIRDVPKLGDPKTSTVKCSSIGCHNNVYKNQLDSSIAIELLYPIESGNRMGVFCNRCSKIILEELKEECRDDYIFDKALEDATIIATTFKW